jgi:hypothetical protein
LPVVSSGASSQLQEDGLPVMEFGDIISASSDTFLRADLNLERVESIRGGSASTLPPIRRADHQLHFRHWRTGRRHADAGQRHRPLNSAAPISTMAARWAKTPASMSAALAPGGRAASALKGSVAPARST